MSKKDKPLAIRKTYIGVEMVEAEPMTLEMWKAQKAQKAGFQPPEDTGRKPGYLACYPDGYETWISKEVFESACLPLADLKADAITEQDVLCFVPMENGLKTAKLGEKTTVVQATCLTGFEITETASCVNPENYDQNKGTQIALDKIKDRLFAHMGFVLQWARNGLNGLNQPKGDRT